MTKNKNAVLITGAAKRIGCEVALNLASKGFDVAISYNNSKDDVLILQEEIIKKYKINCKIFHANLLEKNSTKNLIAEVLQKFSHLNLLVNNASIFEKSAFFDDVFEDNLNMHFVSPLILSKEFAKNILKNKIKNAQIINMVDKNIVRYDTKYFYYLLSKKFLAEFTKMLALQLAPEIRVNAIAPGFILNSIDEENPLLETKSLIEKIPLKKKGEIKNILQTINFLLENDFVNGQILSIDGGASLNHVG
ncbi:MAG TPA: SDR family oxidoreductase [Rickettsiales bacterium]|nr:SDR family oxidoreductase [Rickettsiales bacterium]